MKERPILFSGEMVRAILDGRKTMTRKMVKPQPEHVDRYAGDSWPCMWQDKPTGCDTLKRMVAPLGTIGDRLWVREAFRIYNSASECACYDECKCARMNGKPLYRASDPSPDEDKWAPSIHMPRWASRIDLEITGVRVERVQDITEEDAMKEGCEEASLEHVEDCEDTDCALAGGPHDCCGYLVSAKLRFKDLWQSIYGNWDANPWVWVYKFRRIKP